MRNQHEDAIGKIRETRVGRRAGQKIDELSIAGFRERERFRRTNIGIKSGSCLFFEARN